MAARRVATVVAGTLALALAARSQPAPTTPRLVIVVSVDGLSWSRLDAYRPWYVAGLKRLLAEGRVASACRYRHLNTETGPGHSSLATGAPPRVTGIVANRWFEQDPDGSIRAVSCSEQASALGAPGRPPMFYREVAKDGRLYVFAQATELARWEKSGEPGPATTRLGYGPHAETVVFDSEDAIALFNFRYARPEEPRPAARDRMPGPGNLRVPTLGDRMRERWPASRVVSLSAKDRSAIFLAGRDRHHAVYWFDQDTGRFTSSAAYEPPPPAAEIVSSFNRTRAGALLPARFGLAWGRLPEPPGPAPAPRPTPVPDLLDYQLPSNGLGFDHPLTLAPRGYYAALYVSPMIDELLADLALTFLADAGLGLGRGDAPDVLALSFSAQDTVSHSYGNESEENLDVLRRLDLQLGRVLAAAEAAVPRSRIALALSADHGFDLIPEAAHARDKSFSGGRLVNAERTQPNFLERLNRFLEEQLCLAPGSRPIFGSEGWNLIYNRAALPMRTVAGACGEPGRLVTSAGLDGVLPDAVGSLFREELQEVLLVSERDRWPASDPAVEFARNDLDLERSGDAFLIPRPNVLMHWDPARGSGHGSQYETNTHVPLIFWGGAFAAGTLAQDVAPYDLAPTLAAALGVPLPDAIGRDLSRLPVTPR